MSVTGVAQNLTRFPQEPATEATTDAPAEPATEAAAAEPAQEEAKAVSHPTIMRYVMSLVNFFY